MFKMFAIMCILVNGTTECTLYNDRQDLSFPDAITCEQAAGDRFHEMMDQFLKYDIPFETIEVGCNNVD